MKTCDQCGAQYEYIWPACRQCGSRDSHASEAVEVSEHVINSFRETPDASIRIACFYAGSHVHDFSDLIKAAKNQGKVPGDVEVARMVDSGGTPWTGLISRRLEEIKTFRSVVVGVTDDGGEFASLVKSSGIPSGSVLFFNYR